MNPSFEKIGVVFKRIMMLNKCKDHSDAFFFKTCVCGDGGVGKTALVRRYLTGEFDESTQMTIGVEFYLKQVMINGITVNLQVWDLAGEEQFRALAPSNLKGASDDSRRTDTVSSSTT